MRNEMHIALRWLHRLVQCSCFFSDKNAEILLPSGNRRAMKDALKSISSFDTARCASRGIIQSFSSDHNWTGISSLRYLLGMLPNFCFLPYPPLLLVMPHCLLPSSCALLALSSAWN